MVGRGGRGFSLWFFFPVSSKPLTTTVCPLAEVGCAQALSRWRNLEQREIKWLWPTLLGKSNLGAEFRYPEGEQRPAHQAELLASQCPHLARLMG